MRWALDFLEKNPEADMVSMEPSDGGGHCEPPNFDLEPNVYVQLTAGFIRGRYSFDELVELWPQRCQNLGFYEYFSVWLWDFDQLPGGRAANVAYSTEQIPRYVDAGATSLDCESGNN